MTVRVFRSPFLFIGCYFMAYIYIICTIYAVGVRQGELPEGQEKVPWGTTPAHRM